MFVASPATGSTVARSLFGIAWNGSPKRSMFLSQRLLPSTLTADLESDTDDERGGAEDRDDLDSTGASGPVRPPRLPRRPPWMTLFVRDLGGGAPVEAVEDVVERALPDVAHQISESCRPDSEKSG